MRNRMHAAALLVVTIGSSSAAAATPLGTGFTYQGRLESNGNRINELCDFEFRLFDALTGGLPIGATLTFDGAGGNPPPVNVEDGLFTVKLDFGEGVFEGEARFVEIRVRCPGGMGDYTLLEPRQPVCAAPYAMFALDSPPDFNLPLEATIDVAQIGFSVTNLGGSAVVGVSSHRDSIAIEGAHFGTGRAGLFTNLNALNDANVLETLTNSDGDALVATTTGGGRAGRFEIQNSGSNSNSLLVTTDGTASALRATATGNARAGFFEIAVPMPADNGKSALEANTNGSGQAGFFEINVPMPADNTFAAIEATTNGEGPGIDAFAPQNDGVRGRTNASGTFVMPFGSIKSGVHGRGSVIAPGSTDDFGVAGTQNGDGTGVLGIADSIGHGMVGVGGRNAAGRTLAGVWGMTPEDTAGGFNWPPHFNIQGTTGPKGLVGVLGQAVANVGVWGESVQDIGVVGTTGPATGTNPNLPVGVYGGTGLNLATAAAGYFERRGNAVTLFNTSPSAALIATTNNAGGPAGLFLKPSSAADNLPAVYGQSVGNSPAAVFRQADAGFTGLTLTGAAVHVLNARTTGEALNVQNVGTSSSSAFTVSSNNATGRAATFSAFSNPSADTVFMNSTTTANVLFVNHEGTTGRIARFHRDNPGTVGGGVDIEVTTTGIALDVVQRGSGPIAQFQCIPGAETNAVTITNDFGTGTALRVENVFSPGAGGAALDVVGTSFFGGTVVINGTALVGDLIVSGTKNFRIDHPLDPQNKYLVHSCVESDERRNIYDGTVVTDDRGYATVELPDWFEALNVDFRYQLTVIDESDGDEFVSAKVVRRIKDNRFTIRTSAPFAAVSWQVTGVRQDAYALEHPFQVEVAKADHERGKNPHPDHHRPPGATSQE